MKAKIVLLTAIVAFVACSSVDETSVAMKDNDLSYRLRYTDISASLQAAKKAYAYSSKHPDSKAEALNNMAYVAYQQMRYDQTLHLLQHVYDFSRNQIELLCSDVLTMKVMQRIGQGKSFFDARLRAQKRLIRILSEESNLTERQKRRLHYALTELHIVTSTYYFYLGQDSAARSEIREAAQSVNLETDTTQWLYYQYMIGSGGLVDGTPEEVTITEFNHLFRVYTLAKANHFIYFEANALQSLSAMIADSVRSNFIIQQRADAYSYLYGEHLFWQTDSELSLRHQFAAALSHHAIALFQQYHDLFQTACAIRTLGEVYFSAKQYDEALMSFREALHLASDYKRSPYQVTPWLAGIHENLSLTYSALNDKHQADIHRNIYLDLLDESRQNKELDSRKALLKQEAQGERMQFFLLLLLIALVVLLSIIYYRQLKRSSLSSERQVREIGSSKVCKHAERQLQELFNASEERLESSREELEVVQQRLINEQQRHLLQRTKLSVVYAIIPYLDRVIAEVRKLDETAGNVSGGLSYIQELCSGMMTINDRLTSWIQMQQGRLSLQVSRFPLKDVFGVISMQQYAFVQQHLSLEVQDSDLLVRADKALTLFMVNTLVDNARKFTPAGGKVTIKADSTNVFVEISVCDTGVGLSQDDVQILNDSKVYDPSRIGTKNASKGFGFGIMNCKGIINSYKKLSSLFSVCDFGVESQEGRGSRFWFRLPRVLPTLLLFALNLFAQAMPLRCYELFDSTYNANIQGQYDDALLYANRMLEMVEAPIDTLLLVSLYNEQAIAAQALGEWNLYRRSNAECVRLHRLFSTDRSIAFDCLRLEKMNEDSRVLYVLILLLLIASFALFYMVILRHRLRHRASLDDLYQRLSHVLYSFPKNADSFDEEMKTLARGLSLPQLRQPVLKMQQEFSSALAKLQEMDGLIDDFEGKVQKQRFEYERLYVMNQILDNSLSTIKHETMYFPSRIKQMADDMRQKGVNKETNHILLDLVTYYRHIYMLLYEQAQHATNQSLLRLQPLAVGSLVTYASKKYNVHASPTEVWVKGDMSLLYLLLDQLFVVVPKDSILSVEEHDSMIYIICNVFGPSLTQEQLSDLFSSQTMRMEYLVMRQIIREHDAACGHPGLRLFVENTETGYKLTFSLMSTHSPKN